jgi:hypothetical protein
MFQAYARQCKSRGLHPGGLIDWKNNGKDPMWIVNLATKDHWKHPSKLAWVRSCLDQLTRWISTHPEITSIAVPALGCSNGGLNWEKDVRPMIEDFAKGWCIKVVLFPPERGSSSSVAEKPTLNRSLGV